MISTLRTSLVAVALLGASVAMAQSTTTTKPEVKKEDALKVKFYSEIMVPSAKANRGDTDSVESYNYLGLSKKYSKYETLQVRAVFETAQSSAKVLDKAETLAKIQGKAGKAEASELVEKDQEIQNAQKFRVGEAVVQYSNKEPSFLMPSTVRLYLPTSEATDSVGRYRIRTYYKKELGSIGKVDFTGHFIPQFYIYTKEGEGQTSLSIYNLLESAYKINDTFSISSELYYYPAFSRTGKKYTQGAEAADGSRAAPTLAYNDDNLSQLGIFVLYFNADITENTSISIYGEQDRDLEANTAFTIFNEDETIYGFTLSATL